MSWERATRRGTWPHLCPQQFFDSTGTLVTLKVTNLYHNTPLRSPSPVTPS
ncbi:MAG TPA: hypothetical protein VMV12_05180 [Candidatus Micrarchaeaceae archaeon]|nr:hypothetical protein [Candidatus Micrarchaeaceae archaeon]